MIKKFFDLLNRDLEPGNKIAQSGISNLKNKKTVVIGNHKVKIDRKIAEGGFADIFRVIDCSAFNDNMPYALKRMYVGRAQSSQLEKGQRHPVEQAFDQEISILSQFKDCPNIIQMIDNQKYEKKNGTEVFILLQYCANGTLFDLIEEHCKLGLNGITNE